jgi:hypothetical protein
VRGWSGYDAYPFCLWFGDDDVVGNCGEVGIGGGITMRLSKSTNTSEVIVSETL